MVARVGSAQRPVVKLVGELRRGDLKRGSRGDVSRDRGDGRDRASCKRRPQAARLCGLESLDNPGRLLSFQLASFCRSVSCLRRVLARGN